jgi:uncharacterized membrane protein HdeD (DUF308 family)
MSSLDQNTALAPDTTAPAAVDRRAERTLWWLAIAGALASVILGVIVLAWPDATLFVGAVLFGLWLLVHGVINIVNAITARAGDTAARALTAVIGVLFIIAGVVCLRHVLVSLLAIATVIGVTWLIGGIMGLVNAFSGHHAPGARLVVAALGGITVIGGLVVLLWPGPSLATLVALTGIWLIVVGLMQLFLVLRTRPA